MLLDTTSTTDLELTEPASQPLQPLDPLIKRVWMLQSGLLWLAIVIATLVYDVIHLLGEDGALPPGVLTGGALTAGVLVSVIVPRLRYRFWRYVLTSEELYLERGILNRVRTIVPLRRVQHLDVSQSLLEREFDLGKLIVHTAGSRSGDVVLPGLRNEEAERLRDHVKRYILEDTE
jgi:uncharacterized protein